MLQRLFIAALALLLTASVPDDARKANKAYNKGNYSEAVSLYKQALTRNSEQPKLYFNLGNALLKQEKYDEAIGAYESFKQRAEKPEMKAKASYNIGNAFAEQKEWQKAVNYYREALRFDPTDEEAKNNYEYALEQLKEQKKKQKQQQQNQQNKNNQDQNKQQNKNQQNKQNQDQNKNNDQQQKQKQNQDQQKPNQQDQQQQQNQQQQSDQNSQNQQQQQPKPQSISKEVAEKILNALEDKEKDLLKMFKKQQTPNKSSNGKDW